MAERDPYEVLGVSRSATADEIRSAYRKLARTHHPDVSTEADADKKFAEVQEAYEVLSDAEKRAAFDRFGQVGTPSSGARPGYRPGGTARGGPGARPGQQVDPSQFEDIFEQMFSGGGPGGQPGGGFGGGDPRAAPQPGVDITQNVSITFQTAATGGSEHLGLNSGSHVDLRIPPGIEEGAKLRLRGHGGPGSGGGAKGDLIATIHIGGHPWFTRQGLDLMVNVPITIAEAVCGTKVRVSLLKGSVDVQIPPCSSTGTRLRVRGQGIQPDTGVAGDLFAVVQIVVPRDVPSVVRDAIEPVSAALPDPRIDAPGVETANPGADT